MNFLTGALGVVVVFGVVVFVHEFGHFIVAKKSGVRVERFSFGLGPEIFGFEWGGTRYCLAWIPLGGEVRMAGEVAPGAEISETEAEKDPGSFYAQPWHRRLAVALAGPGMNYLLAFFIFSFVAFRWGDAEPSNEPVVGDLIQGYPAQAAGIKPGDRILSVAETPVATWQDLAQRIRQFPGKPIRIEYSRGGGKMSVDITPRKDPQGHVGLIGIAPSSVYKPVGFIEAGERGFSQITGWSLFTLRYLGGKILRREKPDLAGPVGIATVVAKAAHQGPRDFLTLIGLISVGIGLFNLFPIPLLDGGHMMFFVWEGITRKRATRRVMQAANVVGLSLLLGVLLFATYSDIERLKTPPADPLTTLR